MGLLKAGIGATAGVLSEQWRDYIYCDAIPVDTLMVKGKKRTGGSDNLLSDGSIIAVNEGQCMIAVHQGEVVEVCAEAGEFLFEGGSEPSIFYGDLGESVLATFKRIGQRFTFGGDAANDVRVYFVNTREITGNKYGTATPVPFRVVDANIGLDTDIAVRCNGEFSYRVTDPILFYKNVAGNVTDAYQRSELDGQLKSEFLTTLQVGFGKLSELGIRYSAVPGHAQELADAMNDALSPKWANLRGISVVSVGMNSIATSPEDEERIKELQRMAVLRDPNMRAAYGAQTSGEALKTAAGNEAGAMMGFMGVGMAGNAVNGLAQAGIFDSNAQPAPYQQQNAYQVSQGGGFGAAAATAPAAGWTCPNGHTNAESAKFCAECGSPKPVPAEPDTWFCTNCGTQNTGKFCAECGTPRG